VRLLSVIAGDAYAFQTLGFSALQLQKVALSIDFIL